MTIKDYGITTAIYAKIKPLLLSLAELAEGILEAKKRGEGVITRKELSNTLRGFKGKRFIGTIGKAVRLPKKLSKVKDKKYEVRFRSLAEPFLVGAGYDPRLKRIVVDVNLRMFRALYGNPEADVVLLERGVNELRGGELILKHEVTHLLRDSDVGHIKHHLKRMRGNEKLRKEYHKSGHEELEWEIDAYINAIARLMRRLPKSRRKNVGFEYLERRVPGLKIPSGRAKRKWIKRLNREGLLTEKMVDELQ